MKIKYAISLLVMALAVPMTIHAQMVKDENQPPSLNNLLNIVNDLGSADYEGRLAGTKGFDNAAEYVARELSLCGVQPYQGSWEQLFEIETNQIENATFETYVNANDTRTIYVLGNDFCCAGMTGRGYADANVVFCGYGIDDPKYNEYAHVDAKGKIVMVLSGTPNFLPSKITDRYTIREKARAAVRHGACGLVIININKNCAPTEVQGKVFNGEGPHLATFPIIQPTRACGEALLQEEPFQLQNLIDTIQSTMEPFSFHLKKRFEIRVDTRYHPSALTSNIMGIYPGSDASLKNEYIVVGAHLDHLGMQGETCLFPGAEDNVSGVAVLLEVARMLHNAELQPRRSVVFVLFSGAEQQYLGSQVFVSNFKPLKRIEAFINIECVGSGDSIVALGNKRYPGLFSVACDMDSAFTEYSLARGFKTLPKGDAVAFDKVGIPSLVFTNLNGNKHPHVPSDIPENIDRNYLYKTAKLVYETVYELTFGNYQGRSARSKRIRFK